MKRRQKRRVQKTAGSVGVVLAGLWILPDSDVAVLLALVGVVLLLGLGVVGRWWWYRRPDGRGCAVYRIWDRHGRLVYIGMTNNPRLRMRQHAVKWWWADDHRVGVEWHPNRRVARDVERAAIRAEHPPCNRAA